MLQSVRVQNFQSLRDVTVQFGTLTVILGQNDLGKSALFRAIRLAAEGGAVGTSFITYGSTVAKVTLHLDGHTLAWEKGEKTNRYVLDGSAFEKVGRTIPPELEAFIAMGSLSFDRDLDLSLNFSDQDDPPFLIPYPGGISPSAVAKVLGDLTNLNVLYRAVTEADRRRKQASQLLSVREADQHSVDAALLAFPDVDASIIELDGLQTQVDAVEVAHEEWKSLCYLRNDRESLRQRHATLQEESRTLGRDLSPDYEVLWEACQELGQLRMDAASLSAIQRMLETSEMAVDRASIEVQEAETELQDLLASLEYCPLCLQPMKVLHEHVPA